MSTSVFDQPLPRQFATTLTGITSAKTMQAFLRDVMTEKEIIEMSARLEAARLLQQGVSYASITQQTKLSSRTVARISDWLKNGRGGYRAVLHTLHTPQKPAGNSLR